MNRLMLTAAAFAVVLTGCGKKPEPKKPADTPTDQTPTGPTPMPVPGSVPPRTGMPAVDRQAASRDLKMLGLAFHNFCDANGHAPGKAADLLPFVDNNQKLIANIESGYYVMYFGLTPIQMTSGSINTVVAHTWDVPTAGGVALMGDGSVRPMTKDEFAAAPKASR